MTEHEICIHRFGNDLGHRGGFEFDEGVVFGGARVAVAGEAEAGDWAELGEVGTHLVFVEAVGDASR